MATPTRATPTATSTPRLVWFLHFHKAGGSSVVALARANGEVFPKLQANGNHLDEWGKTRRPWDLGPEGLRAYVQGLRDDGVTFVATEWGVPDLDVLTAIPGVVVVTVIRDPVARLVSNFHFDHRGGYSRAPTLTAWMDHLLDTWTHGNYYARELLGRDWRSDTPADDVLAEATRRLMLLDHVSLLEDDGSMTALAASLGWVGHPVHAERFRRSTARRLRASFRWVRKGRFDLARRAVSASPTVSSAELARARECNAVDLALVAALRAGAPAPGPLQDAG